MAVSLFLVLSRRLQAPVAALLLLGGLQLASALVESSATTSAPVVHVRAALAGTAPAQTAPERS